MRCSFLKFLAVVGMAWAIPQPGPAPTQYDPDMAIKGVSPKPTSGVELRSPAQLFKRQEDRTCGFINADYQNAATCSSDYYCAYNTLNTVFGCCSGVVSDCFIKTACYPSKAAAASCDSSCLANPYNYICTEGAATLCYVYVSIDGTSSLYNFGCGTKDYTSYVYATYTTGASAGASSISSIKPSVITTTPSILPSSRKSEPPLDQSSTPTPSPSPSPSPSPTPAPPGNKTPVGAIVGGVVGGLAVIGIAAVGVIFLLRRRQSTPPAPPVMQPMQQHYDPKPNPYMQPYMQQPGAPGGVMAPQQPISPPPSMSSPMSPPMSPAPPYGDAGQYSHTQNVTVMPKGVHEVE